MSDNFLDRFNENKRSQSPVLNLSHCNLFRLPESIDELPWIEELNLNHNKLVSLNGLPSLPNLKRIYLQDNHLLNLSTLPVMLNLEYMDLSYNILTNFEGLSGLPELKKINIQRNRIESFRGLSEMPALDELDLSYNNLTTLLDLPVLKNLKKIYLQHNHLKDVSRLSNTPELEELDLRHNDLISLSSLSSLPHLKKLYLQHNQLNDISDLSGMSQLEYISLGYNRLSNLNGLSVLPHLRTLHLQDNKLRNINSLTGMINLEDLDLSNNLLSNLKRLPTLRKLKNLDLKGNKITEVPKSILQKCPSLFRINLKDNYIEKLPPEILDNIEALKDYFRSLEKGIARNNEVKVIISGNSTTGKTSLVHFLKEREYIKNPDSTHGILIRRWNIGDEDNPLQINAWDFGGQEYYHSTHRLFLDDSALHLLLWDSGTNKECILLTDIYLSGKHYQIPLEHFHYSYWLELIRYYAPNSPVMMVQTKTDKTADEAVDGKFFGEPYNVLVQDYHLSVEKAYENIYDDSKSHWLNFKTFETKLIEMLQNEASKYELGEKWIDIRDEIRKISKNQPFMSREEFESFCTDIDPDIEMEGLMVYLKGSASTILYYNEDEGKEENEESDGNNKKLKDIVFLNPEWVTDTIYDILSYDIKKDHDGEFSLQHVENVLKEKGIESMAGKFLELMEAERFELIFKKPSFTDIYIAPQYLPDIYKDEKVVRRNRPKVPIDFTLFFPRYMPKSIFLRFMVKYGNLADDIYWKYGILIEKDDVPIFAECLFSEHKIKLSIESKPKAYKLGYDLFQVLWRLSDEKPEIQLSLNDSDFVEIGSLKEQLEETNNEKIKSKQGNWLLIKDFSYLFREDAIIDDESSIKPDEPEMYPKTTPEVFFSYAWGSLTDPREIIVNELYESLRNNDYNIIRDKNDLGYGGLISDFMKRIGKAEIIIVVLSDKYIRSDYCMFELYEAFRNSQLDKDAFIKKIIPIKVEEINLSPKGRGIYRDFWDEKEKEWDDYVGSYSKKISPLEMEEYNRVKSIVNNLGTMFQILLDINTLTTDLLSKDDFAEIKKAIDKRIAALS